MRGHTRRKDKASNFKESTLKEFKSKRPSIAAASAFLSLISPKFAIAIK